MTAIDSNETGTDIVSAEDRRTKQAELLKVCQDEVIRRLADDPKNAWRIDHIKEALKTHNYDGSSMELLARETAKLMEKYF